MNEERNKKRWLDCTNRVGAIDLENNDIPSTWMLIFWIATGQASALSFRLSLNANLSIWLGPNTLYNTVLSPLCPHPRPHTLISLACFLIVHVSLFIYNSQMHLFVVFVICCLFPQTSSLYTKNINSKKARIRVVFQAPRTRPGRQWMLSKYLLHSLKEM